MEQLKKVASLIKEKHYENALVACDELLAGEPNLLAEISRLKSWMFTRQANYQAGVDALRPLLESESGTISDFHAAAFWSLYDGELVEARDWFATVLDKGSVEGETWFESSARCCLAYIHAELGDHDLARAYLERCSEQGDDEVILPRIGAVTMRDLEQFIESKKLD